jgi:hypothetical protein
MASSPMYGVITYEAYGEPATMPTAATEVGANVLRQPQKKTAGTVVAKASEMVHREVISLGP